LDEAGREKRTYKRVQICPVDGPGALNTFERKRRLKEIIAEFGANSEATFRKVESVNLGTTFKEQAEKWLKALKLRKRDPIKPSTASAFESHLNYIKPEIGEMPLSEVNNRTMKEFISKMASEIKDDRPRFSPKSIANYLGVVKMVVASALNEDGEPIYPVKWNHEFMDLPTIDHQNTPSLTSEEISVIIDQAHGEFPMLYSVLAGTGLRIGEALALRVENVRGSVVHVRQSIWQGHLNTPKTENGTREVDFTPRSPRLSPASSAHARPATSSGRRAGHLSTSRTCCGDRFIRS
jgi:integrase